MCHVDAHLYIFRRPLMRALAARGWDVVAVTPEGAFSSRFAQEGIRHIPYCINRASLNPLKEVKVIFSLARLFKNLQPDLIHSFTMKPNIYGALAASWAGVGKRVASVAGLGSFYAEGGSSLRAALFRRGLDRLYAAAMRRVDLALFENRDDCDELVRLGICRPAQCVVMPCIGVDPGRFSPADKPSGGPIVVTMVARLIRQKGVDEYLTAAEKLKAQWGERVVFQLAGDADPGNPLGIDQNRLLSYARRGIIKRLGFIEDIPRLLQGTDIFTLPSYYREGTPVSVLEAMSTGLAVVTTDGVGCRETVIPEESGLLVPGKDAAALAEALGRLISDEDLRRRLGRAARRRIEDIFAADKIAAAHVELYRRLLPQLL